MKRLIASMLLWGSLLGAECRITADVQPLAAHDRRVSDDRLLSIRHVDITGCGREVTEYSGQTVETTAPHDLKPGQRVRLRSLERTPHGKLLVEVIP